jgi:hypothetical protein
MKISRLFLLPLSFFFIIIFGFYFFNSKKTSFNPISVQNNFYEKLNLAIKTSKIEINSLKIRDFNKEVEFYLIINNNQTKVILSTQKDPFWQISTLQQFVKTVRMNQGKLKLVDLSLTHPYATFKNN